MSTVRPYTSRIMDDRNSIKVRNATHQKLSEIANGYCIPMTAMIDIVVEGWDLLPETKRMKAIKKGARARQQDSQ